jgi:chromosome segregation ATPase
MVEPSRNSPQSDWDLKRHDAESAGPVSYQLDALAQRLVVLERRSVPDPWWRNPRTVTLLASLLAAFVPITSAVEAYFKERADLALAMQQQQHLMRMDYMKTALDPSAPELQRQSRLRLLVAILDAEDPVRKWAADELTRVDKNVEHLQGELVNAQQELSQVQAQESTAQAHLTALEQKLAPVADAPAPPPPVRQQLQQQVEEARSKLETVRQHKTTAKLRADQAQDDLMGWAKD